MVEIDVGQVIAGKYELVRLIGKGAMGEVWLATHNSLGGEFAIKLVRATEDDGDTNAIARFQLEAQISAKLSRRTRHIISVSDHGEENGIAYLVMELLEGESLETRIERAGPLSLAETAAIVIQITRALEQAHAEGIVHRDLKPANLFLTRDEDGRLLVKVLDFGIARSNKPFRTRSPVMTGKDMVLGTPCYMSPEQARGLPTLDHRCDLWALAVVAYESLTGIIPWEGETIEDIFLSICTHRVRPIQSLRRDLPPGVAQVFERSFAERLDARFATARELSDALELLVDPVAVDAAMGPRARRPPSDPDLASAMAMAPLRDRTDPQGLAVASPTEMLRRTTRSSGWWIAGIAGILTLGLVLLLGLRSLTTRSAAAPGVPPSPPLTAVPPSPAIPPPVEPVAPAPTPVTTAVTTAKPTAPATVAKGSRLPPQPVAPAPVVTQAPPPPVVVAPPPPVVVAPPPPVAPRTPDKSGVF